MSEENTSRPGAGARLLAALGVTQIVSWGSIYYGFALLLEPLQRELGAGKDAVAGAFSVALLASGLCATLIGSTIDRIGGRGVMTAGSLGAALLLALLARVESLAALYAVWAGLGVVMAATLYEPAFAVITQAFAAGYRRALTLLTLFGGFASTVFWPLTTWLIERYGWRDAMLWLALVNLVVCVPIHFWILPRPQPRRETARAADESEATSGLWRERRFRALAWAFLAHYVVVSAIAAHLIALLLARGLSPAAAAGVGALIGPMQVAGRVVEFGVSRWARAGQVGRIASLMLPASLLALAAAGSGFAMLAVFAVLYGAGNGVMTVVRGTLPVELYGRAQYGAIAGALAMPGLFARAAGPFLAAVLWTILDGYDRVVLVLTAIAALGVVAFFHATATSRQAAQR